jgi:hypothetical protein
MARLALGQTFRILGYISAAVLLPSIMVWKPPSGTTAQRSLARDNLKPPLLDFSLSKDSRFIALVVTTTVAMIGFLPRYGIAGDFSHLRFLASWTDEWTFYCRAYWHRMAC